MLWPILYDLTNGSTWSAWKAFFGIQYKDDLKDYKRATIRIVCDHGKPIAWGLVIRWQPNPIPKLWIYTHPDYRNRGIQRDYILPYWKKHAPECTYQERYESQRQTFKYFRA